MAKIYRFPKRKRVKEIKTQKRWGEELIRRVFGLRYHFDPEEEAFVSIVRSCRSQEEFNTILKMAGEGLRVSRDIYRQRIAKFKDKMKRATSSRSKAAYKGWLTQTERRLAFTHRRIQWLESKLIQLRK